MADNDNITSKKKNNAAKGIRWWPLLTVIGLAVIALFAIWIPNAPFRQNQVIATGIVIVLALLLSILWLMFLSRLRWKTRLLGLGIIAVVGLALYFSVEIKAVSGDLVPIVAWKWSSGVGDLAIGNSKIASGVDGINFQPTDYPQFLGPGRNAILQDIGLLPEWDKRPPQEVWRQPIGEGLSGFAIVGNAAITQEQRGEQEMVVCYDLKTGKVLWSHGYKALYASPMAGNGPRATPTVGMGRVYTVGSTGIMACLDFKTGKHQWSRNIIEENGAEHIEFGYSGSPLLLDTLAIVAAGGPDGKSLVAYHWETGDMVWSGGSDPTGHSSPQLSMLFGEPQILILNTHFLVAHDPTNGNVLWRQEWKINSQFVAQPLVVPGEKVFVSLGYGAGCKLFQISKNEDGSFRSSELWKSPRMKAKFTNVVYRNDHIFGLDDGVLACISVANGKRKWKKGRYGHGQLIMVDDHFVIQAENGDLALVEVNSEKYNEIARIPALASRTWNNPTISSPYLLVRNDREAICYELPLESE